MSDKFQKQLPWRRTWADEPSDDFTADGMPEGGFCRVYFSVQGAASGPWYWVANSSMHNIGSGFAASAREAAQRAEAAWLKSVRGHGMSIFSPELAVKK